MVKNTLPTCLSEASPGKLERLEQWCANRMRLLKIDKSPLLQILFLLHLAEPMRTQKSTGGVCLVPKIWVTWGESYATGLRHKLLENMCGTSKGKPFESTSCLEKGSSARNICVHWLKTYALSRNMLYPEACALSRNMLFQEAYALSRESYTHALARLPFWDAAIAHTCSSHCLPLTRVHNCLRIRCIYIPVAAGPFPVWTVKMTSRLLQCHCLRETLRPLQDRFLLSLKTQV